MLENIGMGLSQMTPKSEDLLDVIRYNIENDSPVLVNIDIFYQVGRDEYYHKKHDGNHVILIYGYSDFDRTIYFLDDVKGYDKYVMKYEDLSIYYNGLFDYCGVSDKTDATIRIFHKKDYLSLFDIEENQIIKIKDFSLSMINNKQKILNGQEELRTFIDIQRSVKNNQDIVSALNSTIQRKRSEYFQYIFLGKYGFYILNYEHQICNSLKIIVENWVKIRNIIAKNVYKNLTYTDQIQNSVISCIKEIDDNEKIVHYHLFKILDKWISD